jgi:hypothetical protein
LTCLVALPVLLVASGALAQGTAPAADKPVAPAAAPAADKPVAPAAAPAADKPAADKPAADKPVAPAAADKPAAPAVPAPMPEPAPAPAAPAPVNATAPVDGGPPPVKGKWNTTFYGFLQFDAIHDSTQSFGNSDVPGNAAIARPGAGPAFAEPYAMNHGRTAFYGRNSRFGFRMTSPESEGLKATGVLEADFAGNQPGIGYGANGNPAVGQTSEANAFLNSVLRIRQAVIKLETPYVDILAGQTWNLFGWNTLAFPATVTILGAPGELFGRSAQLRLSKTVKLDPIGFEVAVAAARPPQRDSEHPDGQAGLKLFVDGWKGVRTMGAQSTVADPLTIGVSGTMRRFIVPHMEDFTKQQTATGSGLAVDAVIPVIPATMKDRSNSLVLTGEFATGTGIADQYTGLTGGYTLPATPNPAGLPAATAPVYTPNFDPGMVAYDTSYNLHTIDWQSFIVGIQYYLPIEGGKVWISGNLSQIKSNNIADLVAQTDAAKSKVYTKAMYWDVNVFADVYGPVRVAFGYAQYKQTYLDDQEAKNSRLNFNAYYLF